MNIDKSWETEGKLKIHKLIEEINSLNHENMTRDTEHELFFWDEKNAKIHIKQRKERNHLPKNATMKEYNEIIEEVLTTDPDMALHLEEEKYLFGKTDVNNGQEWIVVLTEKRKVVTAFKTDTDNDYSYYFSNAKGYHRVGTQQELFDELNEEEVE